MATSLLTYFLLFNTIATLLGTIYIIRIFDKFRGIGLSLRKRHISLVISLVPLAAEMILLSFFNIMSLSGWEFNMFGRNLVMSAAATLHAATIYLFWIVLNRTLDLDRPQINQ